MPYYNQTPSTLSPTQSGVPVVVGSSPTATPVIFAFSPPFKANFPYDGLVAYWSFDGNSYDQTHNGHNGTDLNVSYSVSFDSFTAKSDRLVSGIIRNTPSLDYTGSNIVINNQITSDVPDGPFTIAGWIADGTFDDPVVASVDIWTWGNKNARLVYNHSAGGGGVIYYVISGSTTYSASLIFSAVATGWEFIALKRDTNLSYSFYFKGLTTLFGSSSNADGVVAKTSSTKQGFVISSSIGTTTLSGSWVLDEWGIWSRALTTTELDNLYNNGTGSTY